MTRYCTDEWRQWLDRRRGEVEAGLRSHFERIDSTGKPHTRLIDAVLYSVRQEGKRVRPVLVLECAHLCGGEISAAMPAAIAIECVHTFSLVHDDLPAMDDDDLRRGVPTNHKVFGDALAILAGDWLATHAMQVIAASDLAGETRTRLVETLASGTEAMIVGQGADIESERLDTNVERVRFIHLHKTARLLETACRLGAISAGAGDDAADRFGRYGRHLGLAFQICDDILDCTRSTEELGKRAGKDAAAAKQTFPAALGLDESRRLAGQEIEAALAELAPLGPAADHLRGAAEYVIARDR